MRSAYPFIYTPKLRYQQGKANNAPALGSASSFSKAALNHMDRLDINYKSNNSEPLFSGRLAKIQQQKTNIKNDILSLLLTREQYLDRILRNQPSLGKADTFDAVMEKEEVLLETLQNSPDFPLNSIFEFTDTKETLLNLSIYYAWPSITEHLLSKGIDTTQKNSYGLKPRAFAEKILTDSKLNPCLEAGKNPADTDPFHDDRLEILELLDTGMAPTDVSTPITPMTSFRFDHSSRTTSTTASVTDWSDIPTSQATTPMTSFGFEISPKAATTTASVADWSDTETVNSKKDAKPDTPTSSKKKKQTGRLRLEEAERKRKEKARLAQEERLKKLREELQALQPTPNDNANNASESDGEWQQVGKTANDDAPREKKQTDSKKPAAKSKRRGPGRGVSTPKTGKKIEEKLPEATARSANTVLSAAQLQKDNLFDAPIPESPWKIPSGEDKKATVPPEETTAPPEDTEKQQPIESPLFNPPEKTSESAVVKAVTIPPKGPLSHRQKKRTPPSRNIPPKTQIYAYPIPVPIHVRVPVAVPVQDRGLLQALGNTQSELQNKELELDSTRRFHQYAQTKAQGTIEQNKLQHKEAVRHLQDQFNQENDLLLKQIQELQDQIKQQTLTEKDLNQKLTELEEQVTQLKARKIESDEGGYRSDHSTKSLP